MMRIFIECSWFLLNQAFALFFFGSLFMANDELQKFRLLSDDSLALDNIQLCWMCVNQEPTRYVAWTGSRILRFFLQFRFYVKSNWAILQSKKNGSFT